MALNEHTREDLLREAVQFPNRLRWKCQPNANAADDSRVNQVFCGLRRDGGWSLYVDEDFVLQFNSRQELRRVFWRGEKLAARHGRLEALKRLSRGGRVQLQSESLTADRQQQLLDSYQQLLTKIVSLHAAGRLVVDGRVSPPDEEQPELESDCLQRIRAASQHMLIARTSRA